MFVAPVVGGDGVFGDDVFAEVLHASAFDDAVEDFFADE